MFKPKTIRVFSAASMVLSAMGPSLSILRAKTINGFFFAGLLIWALLFWSSYIGMRLSSYKLYSTELKSVGLRVYLILPVFFMVLFAGPAWSALPVLLLLGSLWKLKKIFGAFTKTGKFYSEGVTPN